MRPILMLLALALPASAWADTLSCRLTRACVQGGLCLAADVPVTVTDASGPYPVMQVGDREQPVTRGRNFFGTVFNGWSDSALPITYPGELWVRPNGRAIYVRRGELDGVTIRTDYRGRCGLIPGPEEPIK